LRFASGFLRLAETAPRAHRLTRRIIFVGLAAITSAVALQQPAAAALVAFVFVLLFSVYMVVLGVLCVRCGQVAAPYFLAGALFAMAGAASTALGVWFGLPFNEFTFHAAELGFMAEGTLLALALAYRMRRIQTARAQAEQLSRTDPLTGLSNRRAFLEQAAGVWSTATRSARPLSVIVIDLDHFKMINDTYGHATGDHALCESARVLERNCRRADIAARWGGEEFILLLPETDAPQARAMAERLLGEIRATTVGEGGVMRRLSASLGVAERSGHGALEDLIRDADTLMYRAKAAGRGRVFGAVTGVLDTPAAACD
jgi:diguanylate cyclase (GGDEF)-like protein